jgi:radical SAM protein with 4Fe4S-binding SPASM domain
MISADQERSTGMKVPVLFSFITLRIENFGAIVFNPFLHSEIELTSQEAYIAGMFNGEFSMLAIEQEICKAFKLSPLDSSQLLEDLVAKLNNSYCLKFVKINGNEKSYSPPTRKTSATAYYSAPKNIVWDITYSCNLKCKHCLTNSGKKGKHELSTNEVFRLIDKLVESKILTVSLVGGEPFVRKDIVPILKYLANTPIRTDISTNGLIIPENVFHELKDLPIFQIQVSIDGIGESHDDFRGRKGAFKKACETLIRLKKEGISTSLSTTATSKNINEIESLINLAVELGCDSYKAIPFIPAGRGEINDKELRLTKQDSLTLSKIILAKKKELADKIQIYTESTFTFFMDHEASKTCHNGTMTCSAGFDVLSIGADGTAYPCPFLHDFPLGNLMSTPLDEIWHNSSTLNFLRCITKNDMTGACKSCNFAPAYCQGGCKAAAFLTTNNLLETDPACFKDLVETAMK